MTRLEKLCLKNDCEWYHQFMEACTVPRITNLTTLSDIKKALVDIKEILEKIENK